MRTIPALDGLRGLAVALVFLRHAAYLGNYSDSLPSPIGTFMLNGWIGVDLFFVLSGFLIARPFFAGKEFTWRGYLKRRALRILPAYWFVLMVVVAGWVPYYVFSQQSLSWRVAYHLMFLQDYFPSDIVVAFWSLGVEEKFYLIAPLLLPAILKVRKINLQLALLSLVILIGPLARALTVSLLGPAINYPEFFAIYRSPFHACIDGLFFGVMLARLEYMGARLMTENAARKFFWLGMLALAITMLACELLDNIGVTATVFRSMGIGLVMTLLVGSAVFGGAPHFFESTVMRWLGRISYSIYLIHIPLIFPSSAVTRWLGGGVFLFLIVYAASTLVAAYLIHLFVETPFLKRKDRLALAPRSAGAAN